MKKRAKNLGVSALTATALSLGSCKESPEYQNYQEKKEQINEEIMEMFHENNGKISKLLKDEYQEAMRYNKKYDALYTLRKLHTLQQEEYYTNIKTLKERYSQPDRQAYARDMIEEEANEFRLRFGDDNNINQMIEAIEQGAYKFNTHTLGGMTLSDFADHLRKNH